MLEDVSHLGTFERVRLEQLGEQVVKERIGFTPREDKMGGLDVLDDLL